MSTPQHPYEDVVDILNQATSRNRTSHTFVDVIIILLGVGVLLLVLTTGSLLGSFLEEVHSGGDQMRGIELIGL